MRYPQRILNNVPRNARRRLAHRKGGLVTLTQLASFQLQKDEYDILAVNSQAGLVHIRFSEKVVGPRV